MSVRTRFAPSPTGLLHIGNARAALFNYLFARHHGGEFLLRIEDTDRERSTQKAVDVIFDGLKWMGLDWDQEPVFQSTRQKRHQEIVQTLLETGKAYKCYATPAELEAMREKARAEKRPPRYNGLWRDKSEADAPKGQPYAIRLKAPQTGIQKISDLIQGPVQVANEEMDDLILLRSDGTPTYLLAVVVDDHDMDITHVIRGDDHLTNSFRQKMIYDALGWKTPAFAHLPLIHGPDGAKLSKRHGAQSVVEFRDEGILPEALCNYLLRLGWGSGNHEILTREEQIALFDLDGVGQSPSRMDYARLSHLNGVWLRRADDDRLTALILETLQKEGRLDGLSAAEQQETRRRIRFLAPALKERAKNVVELAQNASFVLPNAVRDYTEKARKFLQKDNLSLIKTLKSLLQGLENFSPERIHEALQKFAEEKSLKLGQVAQPLRAAMVGGTTSPGIDATLAALGKAEVGSRLDQALHFIRSGKAPEGKE